MDNILSVYSRNYKRQVKIATKYSPYVGYKARLMSVETKAHTHMKLARGHYM